MSPISMTTQAQQRGVVLVVSLLILLVLTLLGISSLDDSIMEEKMASNAQTSSSAFQAAETAIRQTYFAEKLYDKDERIVAVRKALTSTALERHLDHSSGSVTSSTDLVYKYEGPYPNSSQDYIGHNIEIIGRADIDGIGSTNTQGYIVGPIRKMDDSN